MKLFDFAVVGAGIVGASIAAELAPHASVLLLEGEDLPGYHATGRSAAFWSETYGGPAIQPLTTASGPMLREGGFLQPLGSLHIGRTEDEPAIDAFLSEFEGRAVLLERRDPHEIVPGLRPNWTLGVWEPSCAYIDVAGLHAHYLVAARRSGAEVRSSAALHSAAREGRGWVLETGAGSFQAETLVNAAGAWADPVAGLAGARLLGIRPFRRTMVQLRTDPVPPEALPHVADISGSFYFKPEAGGRLWLSPHDEIPTDPCDAAPEDIDVAIAIDRLEQTVDWRIERVERKWAGLRSFAPDRLPVYGFDTHAPRFFWAAGQGGFGIQTAPAGAQLAASLLLDRPLNDDMRTIDPSLYSPARF